jgi:lipopolysaccharide export system permease protein
MKTADRYFFKEYLKLFGVIETVSVSIYLLIDAISRAGDFQGIEDGGLLAIGYFIYKLPLMVSQTLPLVSLLAILGVVGLFVRHNEILALQTAGVTSRRLMLPFLVAGFFMTLTLFFLSELMIPISYAKAGLLKQELKLHKGKTNLKEGFIFKPSKHAFCFVKLFDVNESILYGVTLIELTENFDLKSRLDADQARYMPNGWVGKGVIRSSFQGSSIFAKKERIPSTLLPIPFEPKELTDQSMEPEEMNLLRLRRHIHNQMTLGRDPTSLKMDLYLRLALPFACPILILIAFNVATRSVKPSFAMTLGFSLPLGFGYWVLTSFAVSMGQAHTIPLWLAAWLSNLLFLISGLILTIKRP